MLHEKDPSEESQLSSISITASSNNAIAISTGEKNQHGYEEPRISRSTSQEIRYKPIRHSKFHNITHEGIALLRTYVRVHLSDVRDKRNYDLLTAAGRKTHYMTYPLANWFGLNNRILTGASLAQVEIVTPFSSAQKMINGSSHNYAGFYALCEDDLEFHRICLDKLPIADVKTVAFLHTNMLDGLAKFWNSSCCFSIGTGYQSNLLGIPAIAGKGWLILMDEKCHNSIFTACYMSSADKIKKFTHNDMKGLARILEDSIRAAEYVGVLVIIEGLYSMDGTIPPLDILYQLKKKHDFYLYADEAHSFGSIGKTGQGVLELWNDEHPDKPLPADLIDVRSAVLSKAVGGLGGFVCATSTHFQEALRLRSEELQQQNSGSLTTATILQTLKFLAQPRRLASNLSHLRDISTFCHEELKRQGLFVYGDETLPCLPMLPIFAGRPSKAGKFSHVLRQFGVLGAPISIPAVNIWESRIRVLLSASFTDADVNGLITAIISASRQIGLSGRSKCSRQIFCSKQDPDALNIINERIEASQHLRKMLDEQIQQTNSSTAVTFHDQTIINAGIAAQQQYGIASGAARWICGTYQPHLQVESLIVKLTNQPSVLTYPDSHLGLMSTIAALCRPVLGVKKHYLLLPANAPLAVEEGLRVASLKSGTMPIRYADLDSMVPLFVALAARKDTYITLYVQALQDNKYVDLIEIATRLRSLLPEFYRGCTIFIDDTQGLNHHGPQKLGFAKSCDLGGVREFLKARILISGSFYDAFGLPGGWLAGNEELIEEFRFTSRCYMFTTSPLPFIMAMIAESLRLLLQ